MAINAVRVVCRPVKSASKAAGWQAIRTDWPQKREQQTNRPQSVWRRRPRMTARQRQKQSQRQRKKTEATATRTSLCIVGPECGPLVLYCALLGKLSIPDAGYVLHFLSFVELLFPLCACASLGCQLRKCNKTWYFIILWEKFANVVHSCQINTSLPV